MSHTRENRGVKGRQNFRTRARHRQSGRESRSFLASLFFFFPPPPRSRPFLHKTSGCGITPPLRVGPFLWGEPPDKSRGAHTYAEKFSPPSLQGRPGEGWVRAAGSPYANPRRADTERLHFQAVGVDAALFVHQTTATFSGSRRS